MSGNPPTFTIDVSGSTFTFYKQNDFKNQLNIPTILSDTMGYIAMNATSPVKVVDRSTNPPCIKTETLSFTVINNTPITPP